MITGDLKSKIDRIWDAFWSGGISNPMEVIEQITYLLFLHPSVLTDATQRRHFHSSMFHGYDFDSTMLRIGSMNMLMHGIDSPDIEYMLP